MTDEAGIRTVGVLGVGTMGAGIVQLAVQTGHEVVAYDQSVEALEKRPSSTSVTGSRALWAGAHSRRRKRRSTTLVYTGP